MMSRSIRHRLSLMVLSCVAVVWIVAVYSSFRHASREVQEWQDARLVEYAALIARLDRADLVQFARVPIDARIELARPGAPRRADTDGDRQPRDVLYEVSDATGAVLASSLPRGAAALDSGPEARTRPRDVAIDGIVWRIFALHDTPTGRTIRVMETANTRSDMATGTARRIVLPLLAALPVLAFLLWVAIGRSLVPLKALSDTIHARDADSLAPLGIAGVPNEVRTLVDAIDRLLARLRQSRVRERAFTSDAAHELKTPLAAIKVQAQVALSNTDPALQQLAMQRVVQGVDRSARLAEQLLLLARLDEYERVPASAVAMAALVEEAVARRAPAAREKSITLAIVRESGRAIQADPVLIGILIDNLIDNAIKYGTPQGRVEVRLTDREARSCLAVLDDGPGVAEAERARLTDRFYRGATGQASGSGLGLSIAERIVRYFNGSLRFETGLDGRGLAVIVEFPRLAEASVDGRPGGNADSAQRAIPPS
ncbi:ATP-binding protein [Burkholderia sp. FERM BP-3421]|uniref:ATP-binding protein n=1 Tax=Burkholderia sp. FERM BP-3421 TaxID=1494466 RepID=UPI00235E6655|nr:ATP-binding protein [Burkholderia sp. FERM BP-3421]WDD94117.1 ATP-binding protein [Burkholderia sp. FERM BP-3421]